MRTLILTNPSPSRMLPVVRAAEPTAFVATDKERAWAELHGRPYDLLVLLDLPARRVRSILQRLRQSRTYALPDPWIPVLVVGGCDTEATRALLLDAGADACLPHDSNDAEVTATLRALWRRRSHARPVVVSHELVVNRVSRVVLKEGSVVTLTPPEFCALQCLMDLRPGTVSSRELRERLGERHEVSSMQSVIFQLRTKLGRNAVKTVRGQGYRLAADARWSEPPPAEARVAVAGDTPVLHFAAAPAAPQVAA